MVTAPRLLGPLVLVLLAAALAASYSPRPVKSHPSVVEKSCRLPGNMISVPCKFLDEYLQSTWEI